MKLKIIIAAAAVALSGVAASVPAQAASIEAGFHGSNGSIQFHFGDDHRGPRHDWNGHWDRGHGHHHVLTQWEVRRILSRRGFRNIRFVDTHAPVYKARATNRHGHRVFLALNARNGAIIDMTRIARR